MAVYCIGIIHIRDRDHYAKYEQGFAEIFARYQGKMLALDDQPIIFEGENKAVLPRMVLMEFPSEQEFRAWYESADYQQLADIRLASSEGAVSMIRGMQANKSAQDLSD